jgi:hypothetical protein
MLGGHPQSVFINGLLVAGWILAGLARRGSVRDRLGRGSRVVAGAALGVLAGAIVLLPFMQMVGQTTVNERGGFPGPSLSALSSLAFPDVWGRPDWPISSTPPAWPTTSSGPRTSASPRSCWRWSAS